MRGALKRAGNIIYPLLETYQNGYVTNNLKTKNLHPTELGSSVVSPRATMMELHIDSFAVTLRERSRNFEQLAANIQIEQSTALLKSPGAGVPNEPTYTGTKFSHDISSEWGSNAQEETVVRTLHVPTQNK